MPSAVLIFNTSSGSHLNKEDARQEAIRLLEAQGICVKALDGPLGQQIRRSVKTEADMVVVCGGDGTIRATISAHRGRGRPIGILPGGTMNLLARDYGIPEEQTEAARTIAQGHRMAVDYGLLDGHIFLHAALTGMPVRIGVHRENRRGRMRFVDRLNLALHAISTLPRDPVLSLTGTDAEGKVVETEAPTFAIVVGKLEPYLLPRPHRSSVTAGLMTLFAIHAGSGIDVARMLLRGAVGDLAADPAVEKRLISAAEIRGPRRRTHAMLDGESRLVKVPCAVEVRSGEVEVFAPPDAIPQPASPDTTARAAES
jgi:diacylglycerol kinase family enzyme